VSGGNVTCAVLLSLYLAIGAIIGVYAIDKHGERAPMPHFLAIVIAWPIVIIQTLVLDGDNE
jgi:hypothetical protein